MKSAARQIRARNREYRAKAEKQDAEVLAALKEAKRKQNIEQ